MAASNDANGTNNVSDEQFNLFHAIDRDLYSRLIFDLGRTPGESMQVMGFLMWLQLEMYPKMNLVVLMLKMPRGLVDGVVEEIVACLTCVHSDIRPFTEGVYEIVLLPKLVGKSISLQFLYQHRSTVIVGVKNMVNDVCVRAFKDIFEKFDKGKSIASPPGESSGGNHGQGAIADDEDGDMINELRRIFKPLNSNRFGNKNNGDHGGAFPAAAIRNNFNGGGKTALTPIPGGINRTVLQNQPAYGSFSVYGDPSSSQPHFPQGPILNPVYGHQNINKILHDILPPDRTVFLTFSKGYPVSAIEVASFFTWNFGNFIEAVFMQNVGPNEQVLYARMVCTHPAVVDLIIGDGKAKYTINGRHVWARKYVKNNKKKTINR